MQIPVDRSGEHGHYRKQHHPDYLLCLIKPIVLDREHDVKRHLGHHQENSPQMKNHKHEKPEEPERSESRRNCRA